MEPFLFLIVVEGLSGLVRQTVNKMLYCGVEVGFNGTKVGLL